MATRSASVPAESDILCESCGYTLNGLSDSGNCPECGNPIAGSTIEDGRKVSDFEAAPTRQTFLRTTAHVLFTPRAFFRKLSVRANAQPAAQFEYAWIRLAALLFFLAMLGHVIWMGRIEVFTGTPRLIVTAIVAALGYPIVLFLLLLVRRIASALTSLEARYWGMRLPLPVVTRAMQFHTPHYAPVGLLAVVVTWGYQLLLAARLVGFETGSTYVYTLSAAVVVSAFYLFHTYWIAMRNIMYANR